MVRITGFIREGVLAGLERMLAEPDGCEKLEELAKTVQVLSLSGNPKFEKRFLANLDFPETRATEKI